MQLSEKKAALMAAARGMIIVALDVSTVAEATGLARELKGHVGVMKVGLELLTFCGPSAALAIQRMGIDVMYDAKFHDIPNTVAGATRAVAKHDFSLFTVHASGGVGALQAAADNKGSSRVLGVTILTSIDEEECVSIYGDKPGEKVIQFARSLVKTGSDGIVCSPQELELLGQLRVFDRLVKVTPGVRPDWASKGDQARVMTPREAVLAGADYIVIGRPITEADEAAAAANLLVEEIYEALVEKYESLHP